MRRLNLLSAQITDASVETLARFSELRDLNMYRSKIPDAGPALSQQRYSRRPDQFRFAESAKLFLPAPNCGLDYAPQPYAHGGYDAEVAYIDLAVGRFQRALAARKLLDTTLIVLTSDHGESLGEHGEDTHGYFIYQSTLQVPLILHWLAGSRAMPGRVDQHASLIDLAPTWLDALGISVPAQFQGRSLLRPADPRPIYAESLYARDHLGCSPLRSVRLGRYKYIEAPKPELYDLATDRGESYNLYDRDRPQALDLRTRLLAMTGAERQPSSKPVSPEVMSRLRSLGYLGGGSARSGASPDPKDRLEQYRRYGNAIRLANSERLPEATSELRKLVAEDGQNVLARFYLAVCYFRMRRFDEAAKALDDTLAVAHDYPRRIARQHLASAEGLRAGAQALRASGGSRSHELWSALQPRHSRHARRTRARRPCAS